MKINIFSILTFFCAITLIGISGSEAFGQEVNLALKTNNPKVTALQSSENTWEHRIAGPPEKAIDGVLTGSFGEQQIVETNDENGWFEVDLGDYYSINKIVIHPRSDCCQDNFKPILIVTDQPIGQTSMTNNEKIKASSNFVKYFDFDISKPVPVDTGKLIGRYVRLQMKGGKENAVKLAEIEIFGNKTAVAGYKPDAGKAWNDPRNLTTNKTVGATATQSSVYNSNGNGPASNAIDGTFQRIAETNTVQNDKDAWFELDLKKYYKIDKIVIHPRTDDCCNKQFHSTWLIVTDQELPAKPIVNAAKIGNSSTYAQFFKAPIDKKIEIDLKGKIGRYIRLQTKDARIELVQLEVFGEPTPATSYVSTTPTWDKEVVAAFDPSYPDFGGAEGDYLNTLQVSPKIVGVKNSGTGFDIAFQVTNSKLIKVNTYEKIGNEFKKNASDSMSLEGLGVFGGFAKNGKDRFILTAKPWQTDFIAPNVYKPGTTQLYKNKELFWDGKFYEENSIGPVKAFMFAAGSRMAVGGNSLLITANAAPAHSYQVILDTQKKENNINRFFFESLFQHNYGERAIYDGNDFVVMENRDHDVSVTLGKLNPKEVLPLVDPSADVSKMTEEQKNGRYAGGFINRIFSVYSHTNFGNNTFTELGNVEKGLNDDGGYLVLFAGERDWDFKLNGYDHNQGNSAPKILSPRDIGLVHVKKDFDKKDATTYKEANWLGKNKQKTQCPVSVDSSNLVNSNGTAKKTVSYKVDNDGWDWNTYNCPDSSKPCVCRDENPRGTVRTQVTQGIKWITNQGESYETSKAKATKEFTSASHPKLVRIAQNKYIVLWEEWKAEIGQPEKEYITTKAVSITLSKDSAGNVNITQSSSKPKDIGKIRLMPGDDAFEFDGKAAWAVGDVLKGKLMFYTVDEALNIGSFELEL